MRLSRRPDTHTGRLTSIAVHLKFQLLFLECSIQLSYCYQSCKHIRVIWLMPLSFGRCLYTSRTPSTLFLYTQRNNATFVNPRAAIGCLTLQIFSYHDSVDPGFLPRSFWYFLMHYVIQSLLSTCKWPVARMAIIQQPVFRYNFYWAVAKLSDIEHSHWTWLLYTLQCNSGTVSKWGWPIPAGNSIHIIGAVNIFSLF